MLRPATVALALFLLPWPRQVATLTVQTTARHVQPGELVMLSVETAEPVEAIQVTAFARDLTPYRTAARHWRVLVGIDLDVTPGTYPVTIAAGPPLSASVIHTLDVTARAFPTRRLTVAPAFVNPPPAVAARIAREAERLTALWAASSAVPRWQGPFERPVPHRANSAFGSRSIFNGEARSPHGGADFASPAGTPVRAPSSGRVQLAESLYYTGNTVVLDHGTGLVSLFAHLSTIKVRPDSDVEAGTVLGTVGATGRVTGPHLHWTVRANGARVDPLSVLAVLGPE